MKNNHTYHTSTNKTLIIALTLLFCIIPQIGYCIGSTAAVVIAGAKIRAKKEVHIDKKYPRKDCPVCKGKGKYISGDGIKEVDCGYCEPDKKSGDSPEEEPIIHPPAIISQPKAPLKSQPKTTSKDAPKTIIHRR